LAGADVVPASTLRQRCGTLLRRSGPTGQHRKNDHLSDQRSEKPTSITSRLKLRKP